MGNLFNDQFFITFPFFANPKHPAAVSLHVFHIALGVQVLILGKGYGETGIYFLCAHGEVVNKSYAIETCIKILKIKPVRQVIDRLRAFLCAAGTVTIFILTLGCYEDVQDIYFVEWDTRGASAGEI